MSQKLHVNPETGYVGKCTATVKDCQFGESNHFDNPLEAVRHSEKIIEEKVSQPQKSLKKRKQSNMKMNLSESDTIVDKVDLDSLKDNVINDSYDKKMLNEGYFQGETVQDIRDNLIKQYENVSYAVNLREKLKEQYLNSGYEVSVVDKDDEAPYVEFIKTYFDKEQETKSLDLSDREKIGSGEYRAYDWFVDQDGDEVPISADYERYSLSDDEVKELSDFKVKQLLDDKMKLVSDESLPQWVVLPKQAHKSGNNYKNERITDGDLKQAENVLREAKSSRNKKDQIIKEIDRLKDNRENFAVEFANKLNSSDEDINTVSSIYSKKIEGLTRAISKKENALKNLPDPEEKIAKAEKNLQETKEKHLAYKEEAFVYHLSRHHPEFKNNRKLASNVAQKWLDDNRDRFKKPSDFNVIIEKNEVKDDKDFYDYGWRS